MIETLTAEMLTLFYLMVRIYHEKSVADEYWFLFIVDHLVYVVPDIAFKTLMRFFRMEKTSKQKGSINKIRIRARIDECRELVPSAILLGPESLLTRQPNKGDSAEQILAERFTDTPWTKHNSVPFWKDGDLIINGKRVQIKFNGAELTTEKVLRKNFPESFA